MQKYNQVNCVCLQCHPDQRCVFLFKSISEMEHVEVLTFGESVAFGDTSVDTILTHVSGLTFWDNGQRRKNDDL